MIRKRRGNRPPHLNNKEINDEKIKRLMRSGIRDEVAILKLGVLAVGAMVLGLILIVAGGGGGVTVTGIVLMAVALILYYAFCDKLVA